MKKRYIVFSVFEAILTFLTFAVAGCLNYNANNYTILVNVLIWTALDLIVYFVLSLFFLIIRIRIKHVYYFGIISGFLGVLIACLAFSKTIDDYSFLSTFAFISTTLSLIDFIVKIDSKNKNYLIRTRIPEDLFLKIQTLSNDNRIKASLLIEKYIKCDCFKLIDAVSTLQLSERRTSKFLKMLEEKKVLIMEGNTKARIYKIMTTSS